jgi:hypothetical protein
VGDLRATGAGYGGAAALLLVAAIAYSGLPLEALAGFPLDPTTSYLSELAARDQPLRLLFAGADLVGAVGAALAALLLVRRHDRPASSWARAVPVLLLVFGAATVADVLSPMACAPSVDAACARAEQRWELGVGHAVHDVTSSIATVAAVGLCVSAVLLGSRRARGLRGVPASPGVSWGWVVAPVVALLTSVVVAVIAGASLVGVPTVAVGWWQRAQTLAFSATFVCLVPLLRPTAPRGADAPREVRA